tara:strand:+ start:463 stop:954 length:492 start_codon:yes stop_codon:yes gene_type:complete
MAITKIIADSITSGAVANTPAFYVYNSADQTGISNGAVTKATFDTEDFDTDSAFASSKFTVPSGKGGKYFIGASVKLQALSGLSYANLGFVYIYKNGSEIAQDGEIDFRGNAGRKYIGNISGVFDLSASDYIEIYAKLDTVSGDVKFASSASRPTKFYGYKLL